MTLTVEDIIAKAQARTIKVRVCLNPGLVNEHEEAVLAYQAALAADDDLGASGSIAAAERVTAIEAEMDAATVEFTLRAVSRKRWADLLAQYPPTLEQRRAGHDADPDRFPIAAVAACLVEPAWTLEDVEKLAESDALTFGEWQKLWLAALSLNVPPTPAPKLAAATEHLRVSGRSSTTSRLEASPDPGSLAGSGDQ